MEDLYLEPFSDYEVHLLSLDKISGSEAITLTIYTDE
eukprot:CAMPEP_0116873276 /NCGR_PEP_ID=MMETSP0463-20121206/4302_1 /TAXON_ID=181622 /ORGANISM="Strombidinopsis sp, Strain SopsisLIS2011" /LENGTH=36 /DNA_ID= /DNA_START= /DNA_END= /DNA_ORIENTATION=